MMTKRSKVAACLACALVLTATSGALARPGADEGTLLAQYCLPQPDSLELHRVICRDAG